MNALHRIKNRLRIGIICARSLFLGLDTDAAGLGSSLAQRLEEALAIHIVLEGRPRARRRDS